MSDPADLNGVSAGNSPILNSLRITTAIMHVPANKFRKSYQQYFLFVQARQIDSQ